VTAPLVLGNQSLDRFDVLVIGSGAGGATIAGLLALNGQKVLVLEAGPNHLEGLDDPDPSKLVSRFSNDELKLKRRFFVDPDPLVEPRSFRGSEADGDRTFVGDVNGLPKTVGGGALHADIKTPRFAPQDFHLGTLLGSVAGASFADWPVDYDMLEPFYAWAEKALGVQGKAGLDPFAGPRSSDYPMPPGAPMYAAVKAATGAATLGYTVFPYPCAVNSQPYDGRPACVDCGFCTGYGCPSNAKGAPAVTVLRKGLVSGNLQLRAQTRAVRLLLDGAGSSVVGVQALDPTGKPVMFTADRYVLAASPVEDARLCWLSDPNGVGNSSGQLGRNLTFHLETVALGIFEERLHGHRGKAVSHALTDFRGVAGDASRPLAGIVEVGGPSNPIEEAISAIQGVGIGTMLKKMVRQGALRDRILALTMHQEDAPQSTNRVDLDPAIRDLDGLPVARVTYRNHAFELSARQFYSPKLLDVAQAAGAAWAFIAPPDDIPASKHVMGTLRFGDDPKQSVCDATGRFHDVGNLYAADGALFPTSSGYNPILTIAALAARVGGEMVFPGSPERALL
jgi:gluconate 2-dehydrogenase alpha chain